MPLSHWEQRTEQLHRLLVDIGRELKHTDDEVARRARIGEVLERLEASILELQYLLEHPNPSE
jgi:hypothetical protein